MIYYINENFSEKCSKKKLYDFVIPKLIEQLNSYMFYQYKFYPSKSKDGWKKLFLENLKNLFENQENVFYYSEIDNVPFLIGVSVRKWDKDVFGFPIATSNLIFCPYFKKSYDVVKGIITFALSDLSSKNVKALIFRTNGDNLPLIHACESLKFKYYENIIWPVAKVKDIDFQNQELSVRLINEADYKDVIRIAKKHQYIRGHYYCDKLFDKKNVDKLYAKWVESTKKNDSEVAIIEYDNNILGYFVFGIDQRLKNNLGFNYGRFKSLAINTKYRGLGIGDKLFIGTLKLIANRGVEYIDSGYATKNHISALLHIKNRFVPKYEEITFHYWL